MATSPEPPPSAPRTLLTQIGDSDNYLLVLDNSSMEKFTSCPVSAMNYLVYGREANRSSAALAFGGAIHEGLETLLRGKKEPMPHGFNDPMPLGESDEVFQKRITDSILNYYTLHPAPPDEYRTPQAAVEVLAHYARRATFPDYSWSILSDSRGPIIERAFELPLGVLAVGTDIQLPQWDVPRFVNEIYVAWSGRIDVVASVNGKPRIVDHKTTSIGDDRFVQSFQLANQTRGYVWAAQQLWPEHEVSSFCGNAIFLKKPGKGQGLMERGARGGDPPLSFFRFFFDYSDDNIRQWKHNAMLLVSDFVHCLVRRDFPAHTTHCFGKFGKCPYHDACSIDDEKVRHNMLMSDAYRAVTWNPTASRT